MKALQPVEVPVRGAQVWPLSVVADYVKGKAGLIPKRTELLCGFVYHSYFSPHPGPLPWGEGAASAAFPHNSARCLPDEPPDQPNEPPTVLSPRGRGSGEGNRVDVRSSDLDHSRNRPTLRVLGQVCVLGSGRHLACPAEMACGPGRRFGFGACGRAARCRPLRQPRWPPLCSSSSR